MTIRPPVRLGLAIALLVLILDQLSKWAIVEHIMNPPQVIVLGPFLDIVMAWNRGVSFGMFNQESSWNAPVLSLLALAISAFLLNWLWKSNGRWVPLAIGLIVGGALGNVIDRVRFGAVADFLYFHIDSYYWPAFNVADSGISVGAIMLVWDSLFSGKESPKKEG
ncbi:Lipoprotein signal peptidase [Rhodospirillaceae bacterium LM-1]|nr:Lipoprotein signal peptidase [Rhodospirillaceae bacterium LM-1]